MLWNEKYSVYMIKCAFFRGQLHGYIHNKEPIFLNIHFISLFKTFSKPADVKPQIETLKSNLIHKCSREPSDFVWASKTPFSKSFTLQYFKSWLEYLYTIYEDFFLLNEHFKGAPMFRFSTFTLMANKRLLLLVSYRMPYF